MKLLIAIMIVFYFSSNAFAQDSRSWKITQTSWTQSHEQQFGEFVARIGMAVESGKCAKVDDCLKSSANPYYNSDPSGLKYYSDCADLPYYLRGYFAWKNGLPFSVSSEIMPHPRHGDVKKIKDVRYTNLGNIVTKRYDITARNTRNFPSAISVLNDIVPGLTFSGSLRMMGNEDSEELFSDFYPVRLDRNGIKPGTVVYDPNGHVAVVYRVSDDGRVFYIDAHPDNSLTRGMFTPKFVRSNPFQGAGFKAFRPLTLVDAKRDSSTGAYLGGRIAGTANRNLPLYSLTQFYGTNPDPAGSWSKGQFLSAGRSVNFYDYLRLQLTEGEQHIDPLVDMAQLTDDICISLKDRIPAVEAARSAGISAKAHPDRLPVNIYGTEGEWENYATPSRDARLKVSYMDLLANAKSAIERHKSRDPAIKYNGGNLAKDLFAVYAKQAQACQFSYVTTSGRTVLMNLEAARQRLFAMSFDPYHCIELRWGARIDAELASCTDNANKRAWYQKEQWLRNQSERRYDARMDYSLPELNGPKEGAGVATAPDVDIVGYLKSQM